MSGGKALNLRLGQVCLQLVNCGPSVSEYLGGKCGEFLSPETKPHVRIEVSEKVGVGKKTPLGPVAPDLIVESDNGIVTGRFGDSVLRLSRPEKKGTILLDTRLMPVSLENCLRAAFAALIAWKGDVLLHAAGILRKGLVHVFFGPSEAGKSTISRLTGGGTALSDETMLLYMVNGRVLAQGTPFWGDVQDVQNTAAVFPVAGLYLLHKSQTVALERMRPSLTVAQILANLHSAGQDTFSARQVERTAARIAAKIPCHSLYFFRDEGFWRKIDALRQ